MVDPAPIRSRFALLSPHLDERGRRLFAASEARAAGHGGIAAVSRATGIAPSTIGRGLRELDEGEPLEGGWVRREGGGRKTLVERDPGLLGALLALVSPTERGCPMSPLRWTCLSLRHLAAALQAQGHQVSHTVVGVLLKGEGFSLQGNQKTLEGSSHPGCGAQPGPGRAVRPHRPEHVGGAGRGAAGDLGRYQEEGAGRPVPEPRPRVAPAGHARAGAGA